MLKVTKAEENVAEKYDPVKETVIEYSDFFAL